MHLKFLYLCGIPVIQHLSDEQWKLVDKGIAFYRSVSSVIQHGISEIHQHIAASWRKPQGWQAVIRVGQNNETLVVIHTFGGELSEQISLPLQAEQIVGILCSEQNRVTLECFIRVTGVAFV